MGGGGKDGAKSPERSAEFVGHSSQTCPPPSLYLCYLTCRLTGCPALGTFQWLFIHQPKWQLKGGVRAGGKGCPRWGQVWVKGARRTEGASVGRFPRTVRQRPLPGGVGASDVRSPPARAHTAECPPTPGEGHPVPVPAESQAAPQRAGPLPAGTDGEGGRTAGARGSSSSTRLWFWGHTRNTRAPSNCN